VLLHLLLGLSSVMVSLWLAFAVWPLLGWHARRRYPVRGMLLIVSADFRFGLPVENRFDLALAPETRSGPGWILLHFSDQPCRGILLLADQLPRSQWRRLRLMLRESCREGFCYNQSNF
jgi:hypothetical protein